MNSIFIKTILIVSITSYLVYGYCGELRFFIDDNSSNNYKIIAHRISMNDPLFGQYYMMIDPDDLTYNNVTSDEIKTGVQPPFDFYLGFDFVRDQGNYCWPFIGEGKYEITIYRNDIPVFSFKIDLIHYTEGLSADIDFEYLYTTNELYAIDVIQKQVFMDDWVYSWEMHNQTRDLTAYQNEVLITNLGDGVTNNGIVTKLEQAQWGFPYDHPHYLIGSEFIPGDQIHFWRGAYYGLSISPLTYIKDGLTYKFRNWDSYNDFSPDTILQILSETSVIRSLFYPTQPLTVTNYLEGGTGGAYNLTWVNSSKPAFQWQYGNLYNAFKNQDPTFDRYTIEAPALNNVLGTNWYFQNWNDGSTNNIKSNVSIESSTSFTANYKGNLTSNQTDGFSGNGQRKIVRDNSGYYHCVYSSLGKVWYTKSTTTNFDGNWIQDVDVFSDISINATNPSIDVNDNNIVIVAETIDDQNNALIVLYRSDSSPSDLVASFDDSYFGNSFPVVCRTNNEIFILYKHSASSQLMYTKNTSFNPGDWSAPDTLSYTTSNSKYPSITGVKATNNFYITWQEGTTKINYIRSHLQGNTNTFFNFETVSTNSGYTSNTNPSISLYNNTNVIISWTGSRKESVQNKALGKETTLAYVHRALIRTKGLSGWGDFTAVGSGVNFTNNNSSESLTGETVIVFSQSNGQSSKWINRVGGYYSAVSSLSHNGLQVNVSNGTSIVNQKAMVFNTTSLPYPINRSTTSFSSLEKITSDTSVTYGRTGIVGKYGIEFLFCAEDILLNDENIKFTERVDTLPVLNLNELNSIAKTNTFNLTGNSDLYFSLYYLVINPELATSVLTNEDYVNFKLELVNADNNSVVGTFDDITFTNQNVYDYENISYKIDCTGITEGNHYLRIVADANSSTGLSITNNQNDAGTIRKETIHRNLLHW